MGLWQTGYLDTIYDGIDQDMVIPDPVYQCHLCTKDFASKNALRDHRFEEHPASRPALLINSREPMRDGEILTSHAAIESMEFSSAVRVLLNGQEIKPDRLIRTLRDSGQGRHQIVLQADGIAVDYRIRVDIVDPDSLRPADRLFLSVSGSPGLTVKTVDQLVERANSAQCNKRYVEGLAQYLYAVLAKDQRGDINIPRESFVERMNRSVDALKGFETLPARAIRGLVNFNQNIFSELTGARDMPALHQAVKYLRDLSGTIDSETRHEGSAQTGRAATRIPVDRATETIVSLILKGDSYCLRRVKSVRGCMSDPGFSSEDRTKLRAMIGNWYAKTGQGREAAAVARHVRNDRVFGAWAEQVIAMAESGALSR